MKNLKILGDDVYVGRIFRESWKQARKKMNKNYTIKNKKKNKLKCVRKALKNQINSKVY